MYREINIDDWTLFSSRINSKNYYNADKTEHLKLFTSAARTTVEEEFLKSNLMYQAGVPTPKALEIVACGNNKGIIFEYIKGKKSILRAVTEDPSTLKVNMIRWGKVFKRFHETPCDTSKFTNTKEDVLLKLRNSDLLKNEQKEYLINFLEKSETSNTYLLGDSNPSNFIFVGDRDYIIDVSASAYGNPMFDIARYYSLIFGKNFIVNFITKRVLKLDYNELREGWPYFIRSYYDTDDESFIDDKEKDIRVYAMIERFWELQRLNRNPIVKLLIKGSLQNYYKQFIG